MEEGLRGLVSVFNAVHQVFSVCLIIVLLFPDPLESGMASDLLWSMEHEQSDVIPSGGIVEYSQARLSLSPSAVTASVRESRVLDWLLHQPGSQMVDSEDTKESFSPEGHVTGTRNKHLCLQH